MFLHRLENAIWRVIKHGFILPKNPVFNSLLKTSFKLPTALFFEIFHKIICSVAKSFYFLERIFVFVENALNRFFQFKRRRRQNLDLDFAVLVA
jgi:hypothetical protein